MKPNKQRLEMSVLLKQRDAIDEQLYLLSRTTSTSSGTKMAIICKCGCGRQKLVRNADIKRGWGKFYSKSCKAIYQSRKIQNNFSKRNAYIEDLMDYFDAGHSQDGY